RASPARFPYTTLVRSAEHVGQCHREQLVAATGDAGVGAAPAVLDDAGLDVAVLHHHGVVEHGHVGHAAMAVPLVEIGTEDGILRSEEHTSELQSRENL